MSLTEVILIILGILLLVLSYLLPAKSGNKEEDGIKIDEGLIKGLVEKEVREEKKHINDMVEETLTYSMEKTERAMERLTNEKIMAINEYSDQVLESIHKAHQEVIFLYDMLNDKHDNFVGTVSDATKKMKEIKQEVEDIRIAVKEASAVSPGDSAGEIEMKSRNLFRLHLRGQKLWTGCFRKQKKYQRSKRCRSGKSPIKAITIMRKYCVCINWECLRRRLPKNWGWA